MIDLIAIGSKDAFRYGFNPVKLNTWEITKDELVIGFVTRVTPSLKSKSGEEFEFQWVDGTSEDTVSMVKEEFDLYAEKRPEYLLAVVPREFGKLTPGTHECEELFEKLLLACFLQANSSETVATAKFMKCINWVTSSTFYIDPASSVYHESYEGGLLYHTLKVAARAVELQNTPAFRSVSLHSAVMVALFHDWCKIGFYESYLKNVKNDKTGMWESVKAYRRTGAQIPLGHGATSMFMANQFTSLSIEEAAAIRWHMGKWRCVDDENDELQHANETYPLVHLLQFADQLAIVDYI